MRQAYLLKQENVNLLKKYGKSSHQRCSLHKVLLKISRYLTFTRIHLCWSLLLIKETPTQEFFCEYCEIINNSYFEEHLQATAFLWPRYQSICKTLEFIFYIYACITRFNKKNVWCSKNLPKSQLDIWILIWFKYQLIIVNLRANFCWLVKHNQ